MIIVDDNLHLGTDFGNIFKDIENILFNLTYVHNISNQSPDTIKHRIEGYVLYRLTNEETNHNIKRSEKLGIKSEKELINSLKEIYQELKKEYNGGRVTPEMVSYISDVDVSDIRRLWGDIVTNFNYEFKKEYDDIQQKKDELSKDELGKELKNIIDNYVFQKDEKVTLKLKGNDVPFDIIITEGGEQPSYRRLDRNLQFVFHLKKHSKKLYDMIYPHNLDIKYKNILVDF